MYLKSNRQSGIVRTRTLDFGVAVRRLNHSTTSCLRHMILFYLYTPRNFLGYIAEIFRDIGEGKGGNARV